MSERIISLNVTEEELVLALQKCVKPGCQYTVDTLKNAFLAFLKFGKSITEASLQNNIKRSSLYVYMGKVYFNIMQARKVTGNEETNRSYLSPIPQPF